MKKNPEDRNTEKLVLFVTQAQKKKIMTYCAKNMTTMSALVREMIDGLPK